MTVQASASRFHMVDRPSVAPFKCIVCGNGSRPVVDFGMNLDWYGAVLFCTDCITEAGRVVGLISADEITSERLKSEQSSNTFLNDNDLVAIPREFYDLATNAVRSLSDALSGSVHDIPVEDALAESEAVNADADFDFGVSAGSDESPKQSVGTSGKRRSSSVPSNSGDGKSSSA